MRGPLSPRQLVVCDAAVEHPVVGLLATNAMSTLSRGGTRIVSRHPLSGLRLPFCLITRKLWPCRYIGDIGFAVPIGAGDHLRALLDRIGDMRFDLLDAFNAKLGILATSAALLLTIFYG
jgi:hypothetical protein